MSLTKLALAVALAVGAVGAQAVPTYTLSALSGNYGIGTVAYTAVGTAGVANDTTPGLHAVPMQGVSGSYFYSAFDGSSLTISNNASTFSFLWGSPDLYNTVTFNTTSGGSFAYTGSDLAAQFGAGTISKNSIVFNASVTGDTISSIKFTSSDAAFELAVAQPVPEPETYALMAAGLMGVGFMARRKA